MSGAVWRQIIGISAFNLAVMAVVICFGPMVYYMDDGVSVPNTVDPCLDADGEPTNPWNAATDEKPGCPLLGDDDAVNDPPGYTTAHLATEKHK